MQQEDLWTIASSMVTHYRNSSFGLGLSSSATLHNISWDRANEAFVRSDRYDMLSSHWDKHTYPCTRELAEGILLLCLDEDIQKRFLHNPYSEEEDHELYMCGEHVVCFKRSAAQSEGNGLGYAWLASFSFQFYGPDWTLHWVSFDSGLTETFSQKIRKMTPEAFTQACMPIPVAE